MKSSSPLLEVREVSKHFGGLIALDGVSFDVFDSEIVGLIGPNGAGKTTLFNLITGFLRPTGGKIILDGTNITGLKPHQIAEKQISRTFQDFALCGDSTAFDNVFAAFHLCYKVGLWSAFMHTRSAREEEEVIMKRVTESMDFFELTQHKDKPASKLSSGYQKVLSIATAISNNPRLLLLDEPVTTLSEDRVEMIMKMVTKVRDKGTSVLVIEHNMKAIMNFCDRVVAIAYGKNIAEGLPKEVRENKDVIEAYLGEMIDVS